eukprot:TRINITY_DN6343_c0_g1_i3.p1 TRINITY_DN6343_c0_g1~~TRINITY_DN6343_c0_g1_i3.p1  ORF type:complete len:308 (-),score=55.25 TRINITY_DN6343_c0_g1_i3:56-859(-)
MDSSSSSGNGKHNNTVFYITRHGIREDFENKAWKFTAKRPNDPALSENGKAQAEELGQAFKDIKIDALLSSPMLRTIQTSFPISKATGQPIKLEYTLMEYLGPNHDPPIPLTPDELKTEQPILSEAVDFDYVSTIPPPSSENRDLLLKRCLEGMKAIQKRFLGQTVVLVTHAAPMVAIIWGILGNTDLDVRTGTCSITKVVLKNDDQNNLSGVDLVIEEKSKEKVNDHLVVENTQVKEYKWEVELNGDCKHLSKGEQYHWSSVYLTQ